MDYNREQASGWVKRAIDKLKEAKSIEGDDKPRLKISRTDGPDYIRIEDVSYKSKAAVSYIDYAIQRLSTLRRKIPRANPDESISEIKGIIDMLWDNYQGYDSKYIIPDVIDYLRYALRNLGWKEGRGRYQKAKPMLGMASNPWSMGMGQLKKMAKGEGMQPRKVKRLTAPTVADFGGMIGAGLITGVTASTIGATSNIMMKAADKMARERRKKRMCATKKVLKAMGARR